MNSSRTCPQCQQLLPADAPEGLCPACVMQNLAASAADTPTEIPPPGAAGVGLPGDIIDIGNPAEVAKKLPQFEILELLGRGGMGVVYKAQQKQLERVVALKILPPGDATSADFVERFRREARSLANLSHPNIVTLHEFGESGGLYYFVMEFVDGVNLREMIRTGKMKAEEALALVPKICDALQFAHEEGVVHRDIKPENILVDKRGRVKIADFGLAKILRREQVDHTLTATGMTLGTPRYMAPEQLDRPETVDHRADIYSLGVVFYEMLTGEVPMGRFAPPSEKVRIDVRLDEIVLHALERDVERRYQHASQVRDDVEKVTSKPEVGRTGESRPRATGTGGVFPIRFWWRDWLDVVLTTLGTLWLVCLFWVLPVFSTHMLAWTISPGIQANNLATLVGIFVFLGALAVLYIGSTQSVRVDEEGITINRMIGPSKFLPWATIRRIEPISRWEVVRHIYLWPGLPPRGSVLCGTSRHVYRIDCDNDCWYFSPRHLQPFLAAISQSPVGNSFK